VFLHCISAIILHDALLEKNVIKGVTNTATKSTNLFFLQRNNIIAFMYLSQSN